MSQAPKNISNPYDDEMGYANTKIQKTASIRSLRNPRFYL